MTTTKEELVAASIRRQISYMEGLLRELEEADGSELLSERIEEVEKQLRKLRGHIGE